MEANENQLNYYHHHQQQQQSATITTSTVAATSSPTNGLLPNADGSHLIYPHSVPSAVSSQLEPAKRKRGRPRKYGTPEQALAAKKAATSSSHSFSPRDKKANGLGTASASSSYSASKKFHSLALGNAGQGFTPHVITVAAGESWALSDTAKPMAGEDLLCLLVDDSIIKGILVNAEQSPLNEGKLEIRMTNVLIEHALKKFLLLQGKPDVSQKIMLFMQQSKREMCILSASGCISNASLRQPATSGGNITYEGQFEIISLSGSYVRTELGGRTGGLSVCLSSTDGQLVGGGVGGPLKAAGPVQVIVGTFIIDSKDSGAGANANANAKVDASASKLLPTVSESVSSFGFHPAVDSASGNPIRGNDEHQAIGGSHFMMEQCGLHVTPSGPPDWGSHLDSRNAGYELTGRTGHGPHQSPENGDYDRIPD